MAEPMPVAYEWLMPLAPWETASLLRQSLESLYQQTWAAQRLVISVDGELPAELACVLEEARLPILILEAPAWRGTGPTLAAGLAACRCEWVLRADADDLSDPHRAERQLRFLQQKPHLAVLGCQLRESPRVDQLPRIRKVPITTHEVNSLMHWRNPINHPTVVLRREAILEAGNYRAVLGFEDWDLWLRLVQRGETLANMPEPLVTAQVGEAHLARRHGRDYAAQEARFLLQCERERLMPPFQVALLLLLRLPWRLLPVKWLGAIMRFLRSAL